MGCTVIIRRDSPHYSNIRIVPGLPVHEVEQCMVYPIWKI